MPIASTNTHEQIQELKRRLEVLQERAENDLRLKLKEARAVVSDLEFQLSEVTGRPSASQIKAFTSNRWTRITDEQLEVQILIVLQKEGQHGMNAKKIAKKLNQNPVRIRQWIKAHRKALKRVGSGPGTKFFRE